MKKRIIAGIIAAIAVVLLSAVLVGCGESDNGSAVKDEGAAAVKDEGSTVVKDEGSAAAKDQAILVVSFGTSFNDSRNITIGAIEAAIGENFPDYEVRRAFTAQMIIDKLAERDGIKIDNVTQALDKLVADGIKTVIVQPTHLMNGFEYDDMVAEVEKYKTKFDEVAIGKPLLTSDEDFAAVIKSITERTASYMDGSTAVVFMGHGTEHEANAVYGNLQTKLTAAGHPHYLVGTVEGTPTLTDVVAAAKTGGYKRVVLEPLMVVSGDHANNDMAGDEEGSWKTTLEAEGFKVEVILEGLGQFNEIQDIYVQHVKDAIQGVK
ncbi:MAG: sirohydrochlorin cobaltochelatase [Thermoleophilia bacterium]